MIFRFRIEKCRAQRCNRAIQDKEIRAKQSKDRIAELLEEKCDVMIAPTIPYGATNTIHGCPGTITIGTDEPHLASEEWGKEMLQTMADYIADFIEEYEKNDLPHPAE